MENRSLSATDFNSGLAFVLFELTLIIQFNNDHYKETGEDGHYYGPEIRPSCTTHRIPRTAAGIIIVLEY